MNQNTTEIIYILNILPLPEQDNLSRQSRNLSKARRCVCVWGVGAGGHEVIHSMKAAVATLAQLRFLTLSMEISMNTMRGQGGPIMVTKSTALGF